MDDLIRIEFGAENVRFLERASGGCISDGVSYDIDDGRLQIFVKYNKDDKAKVMFHGEYAGLNEIRKTMTIKVPFPNKVVPHPTENGWVFMMEYIKMAPLRLYMKQLGLDLARLHLHNLSIELKDRGCVHSQPSDCSFVDKFGFDCTTCCGFIPMCNEWESDWTNFYARHRLKAQIDLVMQKYGHRQVMEYWTQLERKLPTYFEGANIKPSLLHRDLWSGNAAETANGPVVFDPASFYGHNEFDLAICQMFGGFSGQFYEAYHSLIPKSPGFETRQTLYLLFHNLNHWNHFGSGYQDKSLQLMKQLLK